VQITLEKKKAWSFFDLFGELSLETYQHIPKFASLGFKSLIKKREAFIAVE
jgi:hypothetical protein